MYKASGLRVLFSKCLNSWSDGVAPKYLALFSLCVDIRLGGHLAMAFGTLFDGQTDQVTTFNAPGFDTNPNVKQAA